MRVLVAGTALRERDPDEPGERLGGRGLSYAVMALRAGHLGVRSIEWELSPRVIEWSNILPAGSHMAAFATGA